MDSKDLRIGVVVDEGQTTKFENAIRRATIEVSKLADQLNRASKAFQGFLGGAKMTAGGGMQFRQGGGFAKAPMAGAGGISQPVASIANAISATAKGSNDALRSMEGTLRTSSSKMASDVHILDAALAKVEKRLGKIKSISGGGGAIPGIGAPAASGFVPPGYKVVNRGGVDTVVPASEPADKKSFGEQMRGFLRGGDIGGGNIMQTIRKALPYAIAYRGALSLAGEISQQPNDFMNQAYKQGSTYGGLAAQMMHGGGFTTAYALRRIAEEGGGGGVVGRGVHMASKIMMTRAAADHAANTMGGRVGSFFYRHAPEFAKEYYRQRMVRDVLGDDVGNAATDLLGNTSAGNSVIAGVKSIGGAIVSMDPGKFLRALEGADPDENQRKLEYAQKYAAAHAAEAGFRARQMYENQWEGMIATARALGNSDPFMLAARLRRRGFNTGDLGAAQGSITPIGGFNNARRFGDIAMRATAGHVDIGSLIGATLQAGGNASSIARQVGGLGIDPQAMSVISNAIAQQTMSGGAMVNPEGMLSAFAAFNGAGSTNGEQMRIANAQASGMQAMNQNLFSGGIDNLQKGRNWLNAINAAGGNLGGQNYLVNSMNMGMLAELRRNPNAHIRELDAVGLSNQQALNYGDATLNSMFRNVGVSGNNPMSALARQMQAGGYGSDFGRYISDQRKGNKKYDPTQDIYTMGQILKFEGFAQSDQQAYGLANDLAGLGNMGNLRKGGFRDAASGTNMMATAKAVGERDQEAAAQMHTKDFKAEAAEVPKTGADQMAAIAGNIGLSSDAVAQKLLDLADAIDHAASAINKAAVRIKSK